ncbi:MAG TPA: hypothetical protein VFL82_15690, partial [Thermomicrobiales bacterium]|nr:hypothetical protein [Thermomicrobiales bacterium]
MTIYRFGTRYSRWDGTQQISDLSADEIMDAISDDLMHNGNLDLALQRLFSWGFQRPDGEHVPGLREMMNRLRQRRQEQLNRYDLGSILDDIKEQLEQIVQKERAGIDRRVEEGRQRLGDEGAEARGQEGQQGQQGQQGQRGQQGQQGQAGQAGSQQQRGQQPGGQQGQQGSSEQGQGQGGYDEDLQHMLEQIAAKKRE